jgi:NADPH-dependent 2,4-dienoyl-CoA reductase/sulfur reductase-like enzyme
VSHHFDVVIAGGGPGGIAAAVTAAEAGKQVCLLDANPAPGGQIWRGATPQAAGKYPHGATFASWHRRLHSSGVTVWPNTHIIDIFTPNRLRVETQDEARNIGCDRLILATGARERFLPFPGWTLPGVMGVGGAQALVKSGLDPAGKRVVIAGTGPLLLAVAANLARAGAVVQGIFEQASYKRVAWFGLGLALTQPGKLLEGARYRSHTIATTYHAWITAAEGRDRVESVTVSIAGKRRTVACDWLACAYHLVPNLELPRLLGCNIATGYVTVDALQQSSVPNVYCVGELTGIGGLQKALVEGRIAGFAAAGRESAARALQAAAARQQRFARSLDRAFALRSELRSLPSDSTIVCRCEDVRHNALAACNSWRAAKLHTRCGMGPCQGRVCGSAAEFLYGWDCADFRPPAYPARIATLAGTIPTGLPLRAQEPGLSHSLRNESGQ